MRVSSRPSDDRVGLRNERFPTSDKRTPVAVCVEDEQPGSFYINQDISWLFLLQAYCAYYDVGRLPANSLSIVAPADR